MCDKRIRPCPVCGGDHYYYCGGYDPVHSEKEILSGEIVFDTPDPLFRLGCRACEHTVLAEYFDKAISKWNGTPYQYASDTAGPDKDLLTPIVESIWDRLDDFFAAETEVEKYVAWRVAEVEAAAMIQPHITTNEVMDVLCRVVTDYLDSGDNSGTNREEYKQRALRVLLEEKYWYDRDRS